MFNDLLYLVYYRVLTGLTGLTNFFNFAPVSSTSGVVGGKRHEGVETAMPTVTCHRMLFQFRCTIL
jgi:hypothetical protein